MGCQGPHGKFLAEDLPEPPHLEVKNDPAPSTHPTADLAGLHSTVLGSKLNTNTEQWLCYHVTQYVIAKP